MQNSGRDRTVRLAALTLLASVMLLTFLAFMPSFRPLPEFTPPRAGVGFIEQSDLTKDDLELISIYDYSPVFLTTNVSYASFKPAIPTLSIPTAGPSSTPGSAIERFRESFSDFGTKADMLHSLSDSYMYSNFMQNSAVTSLPEQGTEARANMSVVLSHVGTQVFSESFEIKSVQPGSRWTPVEMFVIVGPDGAWSVPLMVSSTGLDALDDELAGYVRANLYRMKLKRGYYTVTVSP